MREVERRARRRARWNKDGTDTGDWLVTGTSRKSIKGYVAGTMPTWATFDVIDPKYHTSHWSPELSGVSQLNPLPSHIVGRLTMTEQHSRYLQTYEIEGTKSGKSPLTAGEPITQQEIRDSETFIWATIRQTLRQRNLIK